MKYELRKNDYKYYETVNLPHTLWRVSTNTMFVAVLGITFFVTGYFCPRCASFDLVPKFETSQKSGDHVENIMELIPNIKYILHWTPKYYAPFYFYKDGNRIFTEMKCAWTSCYVTANRNLLGEDVTKFHAIAFNGRSDNIDPPKARSPRQKYIFFNMESADNYPVCSSRWDGFFNWTATYRLDSDIPFPYIQIKNQRGQVVGPKPNMKWQDADSDVGYDYRQNKTKAVAWFVSHCKSRSDRGRVAADLAEALKRYGWTVDIYGSCGDHSCPRFDKKYDCSSVLKRDYFFYLSFENSFSEDYVTEKLLTALQHDVVPIVLGGADYSRFLPPGSYLNAGNISSEDLASAIDRLIRSPSEYKKFFRWKTLYWYRNPSTPDSVCAMCAALHNHTLLTHFTSYSNFRQWWNPDFERRCAESNSSGALVPPYDYNGFIAKLEFLERQDASDPTPTMAVPSQPLAALVHPNHNGDKSSEIEVDALSNEISTSNGRVGCGATVRGYGPGGVRSGHFDTRTATWRAQCAIHLIGTPTDVIQVSLFNYNLRLQSCRSHIEILEGLHELSARGDRVDRSERIDRALLRVCGPAVREARDPAGRFLVRQAVTSKGSNVTIFVRRASSRNVDEEEFVDGGFAFHDEQHEGTVSPDATCAATHYGLSSPPHGGVSAPSHHHIFWNIEERLICTHRFIPASNQSVTIEIQRLERMWSAEPPGAVAGGGGCRTACGDAGCECRALTPLTYHDHIALVAGDGTHLSCLCGDFQAAWLPVVVRSWTSLRLEYSVAHYTYASRGFDYAASYSFNDDAMCGQRTYTTHSGEISSKNVSVTGSLNEFFYQQCTWVLDSNVERQLFIDISSEQDKSCSSWNITLHEWSGLRAHSEGGLAATAGELLYTFCARHKNHTYTLPWRLNTVVIRLVALSRQQPLYSIRWRSQVVRANNRLGPPTPAPAAAALAPKNTPGIYSIGLIVVYIYLGNM